MWWSTLRGRRRLIVAGVAAATLSAVPVAAAPVEVSRSWTVHEQHDIGRVAAEQAECGPGSRPETGMQGEVPVADRESGRSREGYDCNLSRVGGFVGFGSGVVSASHDHCAYLGSVFPSSSTGPAPGVQVVDVSDPTDPVPTANLTAAAMTAGTWESLKVHDGRRLLVGTGVPFLVGAGLLSVYDVSDCAHPRLLNEGPGTDLRMPLPITSHEGGFSPDGNTYWSTGNEGIVSAVDLTDPAHPRVVWQGHAGISAHGFGFRPDGNRMYLANNFGGITILDTSAVQRRDPDPRVPQVSQISWTDGWATQHVIPVTYDGKPYLFAVDEGGSGGVKLVDVSDEAAPRVVHSIKLAVNLPENIDRHIGSAMGGSLFGYEAHYCSADRPSDPTALACGWFGSGVRVFDVTDPVDVREIAYHNPPAVTGRAADRPNSSHVMMSALLGAPLISAPAALQSALRGEFDPAEALTSRAGMLAGGDLSTDWCVSPPAWRGNQLWVTCADNGFLALRLADDVYTAPPDQRTTIGS